MTLKSLKFNDIGLKLFMAFIVICPIFYDPSKMLTLRTYQEQFFQLGITVLFAVVLLESIHLSLFLLWAVFLYAYYGFPPIGGNYVMNIVWGCLLYQIAYKVMDRRNIHVFYKCVIGVALLNLVWVLLQISGVELIFLSKGEYNSQPVALLGLKAFMGMFFALSIPFLCRYSTWAPILFFVPIYLSECSVAMAAGVVSYLFHLFYYQRKAFWVGLVVLTLAAGAYIARDTKSGMFTDRFNLWKVTLRDAFKKPVVGWGLDSFRNVGEVKPFIYFKNVRTLESKKVYFKEMVHVRENKGQFPDTMKDFVQDGDTIDPWDHPHNEYVSLFYEFGLVGVVIFACLALGVWRAFYPSDDLICLMGFFIGVLIISTGQFPFHVARIGYLVPIVLGIYKKLTDEENGVICNV